MGDISLSTVDPHPKFYVPSEIVFIPFRKGNVVSSYLPTGVGTGSYQVYRTIGIAARSGEFGVKGKCIAAFLSKFPLFSKQRVEDHVIIESRAAFYAITTFIGRLVQ